MHNRIAVHRSINEALNSVYNTDSAIQLVESAESAFDALDTSSLENEVQEFVDAVKDKPELVQRIENALVKAWNWIVGLLDTRNEDVLNEASFIPSMMKFFKGLPGYAMGFVRWILDVLTTPVRLVLKAGGKAAGAIVGPGEPDMFTLLVTGKVAVWALGGTAYLAWLISSAGVTYIAAAVGATLAGPVVGVLAGLIILFSAIAAIKDAKPFDVSRFMAKVRREMDRLGDDEDNSESDLT